MTYDEFIAVYNVSIKHYSVKKKEHAISVLNYVMDDCRYALMTDSEKYLLRAVAVAHDVIEDTKCSWSELQSGIKDEETRREFYIAVDLLTHRHEDSYIDYIDQIIKSENMFAIITKQADMKDHLMRKQTLTKKLKEKYEPVMPRLLRA